MVFLFPILVINWSQVLIAGLFGAVGGGLGFWVAFHLIAPKLKGDAKKNVPILVAVVIFSIFYQMPKVLPDQFSSSDSSTEEKIFQAIEEVQVFRVILGDHPELRPAIEARLLKAYDEGSDSLTNEAFKIGQELGEKYFPEYIPYISNQGIDEFVDAFIKMIKTAYEKNPTFCFHFLFGGENAGIEYNSIFSKEEKKLMERIVENVIKEKKGKPEDNLLSIEKFSEISKNLINEITSRNSAEDLLFEGFSAPGLITSDADKKKTCFTMLEFYRAAARLPESIRHKYLRTAFAAV